MKNLKTSILALLVLGGASHLTAQGGFDSPYVPVSMDQTEEAVFPESLVGLGIKSGAASIAIAVDDKGQLTDYLVTGYTHPEFARSAVAALKKWKFQPAQIHGYARNSESELTFKFQVEGVVVVSISALNGSEIIEYKLAPLSRAYTACTLAELDRIPTPSKIVNPIYPKQVARSSRGGRVSVKFYIDEEGNVRMPSVSREQIEENEELAAIAVGAVSQWKFDPPLQKGRPVLVRAEQVFNFNPPTPTPSS